MIIQYIVVMLYYFHQTGSLHSHASSVLLVCLLSCHEGRTIYFIGRVPPLPPSSRLFAWDAASGSPRQADKNQGYGKRWDKRYELPTSDYSIGAVKLNTPQRTQLPRITSLIFFLTPPRPPPLGMADEQIFAENLTHDIFSSCNIVIGRDTLATPPFVYK